MKKLSKRRVKRIRNAKKRRLARLALLPPVKKKPLTWWKDVGDVRKPDAGRAEGVNYREYIHSPKWIAFRMMIRAKRKRCEDCNARYGLTVHHLRYTNLGNEKETDVALLCWPCHQKRHPEKAALRGSP